MTVRISSENGDGDETTISSEFNMTVRSAIPQVLAVAVKNVLLLGFGMTLGIPTVLIPNLSKEKSEESFSLDDDQISWISSLNLICVPIGCLLSGITTTTIGRKRTMQLVNIPFLTSWLLFYYSEKVWQIYLALALTGLAGGLLEAPVLTYVAEVTQAHLRGLLSATSTFAITLGILVEFLLATWLSWRYVALASCFAPILSFCLLFLIPESPYWLITKSRMEEARSNLAWLRGWTTVENVQLEFKDLCKAASNNLKLSSDDKSLTFLEKIENFKKKNFTRPFLLVTFVFFAAHFSGMTTLQTFAVKIFNSLNSPIESSYATVFLGVAELIGCISCVALIHYLGKRILTFVSLIGNFLCLVLVGIYANYYNIVSIMDRVDENQVETKTGYEWMPTTLLILSAFLTHTGIRILPWILTGEVYSKETRATASGLSSAIGYVFSFAANKSFLSMVSEMTLAGVFWFGAIFSFFAVIILYFFLPETEGKLLYEINDHFSGLSKLGNDVRRQKNIKKIKNKVPIPVVLHGNTNNGFIKDEGIVVNSVEESKF